MLGIGALVTRLAVIFLLEVLNEQGDVQTFEEGNVITRSYSGSE